MTNEKYTKEQLEQTTVAVLRSILASKGGAPLNKPKTELISEILNAQEGIAPERSNKGRPRLSGVEQYKPDVNPAIFNFNTPKPELVENPQNYYNENLNCDDSVVNLGKTESVKGVLDLLENGNGFLRVNGYSEDPYADVFVSKEVITSFSLLVGDYVEGIAVTTNGVLCLRKVDKLNGVNFAGAKRENFDALPVCYPNKKFNIVDGNDVGMKVIDLIAPIGKGQRSIIYAPEKAGKSGFLKRIVSAIENNNNEVKVINLLINRRPEDVTEYKMGLKSEVISLDYNVTANKQVKSCELILNRAKRLVEQGVDVVIALDDITSLVKSYNYALNSVKTLGGIDVNAVLMVKQFFGSARNVQTGGSLTIICIADVNTIQDELIVSELKGVSNMEVELSTKMANRGIYPPIITSKTYTRNVNALLSSKEKELSNKLREIDDIREIVSILND
ncbi:MAG: hypothetical protein J6R88_00670 [Clostridia bacterium]|nr:hypothetical protein [Clostridia bacterium]